MTYIQHDVSATAMRGASRNGLPTRPSHSDDEPCSWGICGNPDWVDPADRAAVTLVVLGLGLAFAVGIVTWLLT